MKRNKVPGSGRKVGTPNVMTNELREQLRMHLVNELDAIQGRLTISYGNNK